MSAQPNYLAEPKAPQCFQVNVAHCTTKPGWLIALCEQIFSRNFKISYRHEEALARLVPLLLCGEQSAIHVFSNEIERLRGSAWSRSITLLKSIETDEYAHEDALQTLTCSLMQPSDLRDIKRQARHFYIKLGNTVGMVEHFARIAQLDACVCIIMNAITNCDLEKSNPVTQLFDRIKKDEARHVAVSKKHFQYLGGTQELMKKNKRVVSSRLVSLLRTEADSFETLGIDADLLFNKLEHARQ